MVWTLFMKFSQSIVWCNSLCWKTYSQEIFTNLIFKQPQCRAFIVNMQSLPPMSLQSHRTSWKAHLSFPFVIFKCEERKNNQQRLSFLEFRRKDEVFSISLWRFGGLALLNQGGWAWGKFWIKSGDGLIDGKTGRYSEYIIMKKNIALIRYSYFQSVSYLSHFILITLHSSEARLRIPIWQIRTRLGGMPTD